MPSVSAGSSGIGLNAGTEAGLIADIVMENNIIAANKAACIYVIMFDAEGFFSDSFIIINNLSFINHFIRI
ncbi:hypothetical protein SDC9_81330 [bioreactor metagenome]|uniref:Uncharacterized protein n=1 Tax=bioreactor metagenome TaxID=1076179 RepID=A0A644Z7Q1_9ZZZZ